MIFFRDYLTHIGLEPSFPETPDIDFLTQLVTAHLTTFTYQNTALFIEGLQEKERRTPSSISVEAVFEQFISKKHTGYCFQNIELLAWGIEQSGFKLSRHLAKPINQLVGKFDDFTIDEADFAHEVIIVDIFDESWLIDTACAHNSLRQPLKIVEGEQYIASDLYQLTIASNKLRVAFATAHGWYCLYDICTNPASQEQIERANDNLFKSDKKIPIRDDLFKLAMVTPGKRKTLCVFKEKTSKDEIGFFKSYRGAECIKDRPIFSATELKELAEQKFGIDVDEKVNEYFFSTFP